MKLKKINEKLRRISRKQDNQALYRKNFLFKKKKDFVIIYHQKEWKSTIIINVIQQLFWWEQSLALIIVEDKAKVLEMEAIFENSKGILIWWFTGTW
jgi:hypothetical protein